MAVTMQRPEDRRPTEPEHSAEAILSAVVFGAREFLRRPDWGEVLDMMVARLGEATGAHQVRAFQNDRTSKGEPARMSLRSQWIAPGANPGTPRQQLAGLVYRDVGCERWERLLSAGQPVVGLRAELPTAEHAILEREGVVSMAIVPVFSSTGWWGFIGFFDCVHPRTWTQADLDALTGAADIMGAAFARSEMEARIKAAVEQERLDARALRRSEDRYRRLVQATFEGIVIHDGERIVDVNPSLLEKLGYQSADELIGLDPLQFIHPESRGEARWRIATHDAHPYEALVQQRDGSVFPAEIKGSEFMVEGRRLRVSAIRDITERKEAQRMEKRLLEQRAAFAASEQMRSQAEFLLDATRILSSSFDTTTTLQQLAHLAVRYLADFCIVTLFGPAGPDIVAVVHADRERQAILDRVVRGWGADWPEHPLAKAQRGGEAFIVEKLTDAANDALAANPGQREDVRKLESRSLMSIPIRGGGELIGSLMFVSTQPDRVYTEQHKSVAMELARRAADAVLSARSYHAAQAATKARDDVLAVVAHDLRNPLHTIQAASSLAIELLADRSDVPEQRQLRTIQRTADHMNRLIQDLVDATRLQAGQFKLELDWVSADWIVAEALEMLQPLADSAGLVLTAHVADGMPSFMADRLRLQQVLSNLVGNAMKFTQRGGHVGIEVRRVDADVEFSVSDTGRGIPPEELPHIFGKFWKAGADHRHGLGLGLSIAKGIVAAHGGSIHAESQVGVGTRLVFTIPGRLPATAER